MLASVGEFLERQLKLKVNLDKSAVVRPWQRKFLWYSMTVHLKSRLKVARGSAKRIREKLRRVFAGEEAAGSIDSPTRTDSDLTRLGKLLPAG